MLYPAELRTLTGRGERIRTFDIQLPKLARYQTALHPEKHAEFTFILFRMQAPFLKKNHYFVLWWAILIYWTEAVLRVSWHRLMYIKKSPRGAGSAEKS
jgi:hypothetical protein